MTVLWYQLPSTWIAVSGVLFALATAFYLLHAPTWATVIVLVLGIAAAVVSAVLGYIVAKEGAKLIGKAKEGMAIMDEVQSGIKMITG